MAEMNSMDNLISAKIILKSSLETSKSLAHDFDRSGQRLEFMKQRLCSKDYLENCTCAAIIKDQIAGAVCPAMAVLNMCNSIKEMEKLLLLENPASDLYGYLLLIKKIEEALKFLGDNCELAIQWMEGIKNFIEENLVRKDSYVIKINMCLSILKELKAMEEAEILSEAFRKLEIQFSQLLEENTALPLPLPAAVMQKIEVIISKLNANNRISNCLSRYVQIRSKKARTTLQGLELNYINMSVTELDDVQDIQVVIDQWCNHLEFALKYVFKVEFELRNEVFNKIGSNIWRSCLAEIAAQSGIVAFLQFGIKLTKCRKDAVKLLKLLDMFECMDKLRSDFNWVFAGEECFEIRNLTRELIKEVVDGACEIFFELPFQVKLQRQASSPSDGTVPRLVRFVTDYCDHLLGEDYKSLLIKILTIHKSWKNGKYKDTILTNHINLIIKEISVNLDTWSQSYQEKPLSYLFMMNNHFHFCNLKGTELGILMGESWIRAHDHYKDYYMRLYLKETWGKILDFLGQDEQDLCSVAVRKRFKAFNEALDGMYEKQSNWVVPNEKLRLEICYLAIELFLPCYTTYLKKYSRFAQQDIKYTAKGLESMLSSLFQPKIRMYGSIKHTHWIDEVKNIDMDHIHHFTLMAV